MLQEIVRTEDTDFLYDQIEALYVALDKLNTHHFRDHHKFDPDMPTDVDVAKGYYAYRIAQARRSAEVAS